MRTEFPLINAIHDCVVAAHRTRDEVLYIAELLREVGLDKLADRAEFSVNGLVEAAVNVRAAQAVDVQRQIDHSQEVIGGLLVAALEGCLTPKRSTEKV